MEHFQILLESSINNCTKVYLPLNMFFFFCWTSPDRLIVTLVSWFCCSWQLMDGHTTYIFSLKSWFFLHWNVSSWISSLPNMSTQVQIAKSFEEMCFATFSFFYSFSFCDTECFALTLFSFLCSLPVMYTASSVHLVFDLSLLPSGEASNKTSSWNYRVWPSVLYKLLNCP